MSSTESLDFAKKVIRHVWAKFIDHFDAEANVDHLYSEKLIDESMMEVILNAKSKKDGNRAFLSHLRSNATIESLWKLCTLLRGTAEDHQRHDSLATLLEGKLNPQSKVPCQAVVHRVTGSESRPSSLHFSLSELTDTVISAEESAASCLGIAAALDLSTGIHLAQQRSCTGRWRPNDPPHRRLHDAFLLLQSRLAKLFDKHIIGLKPYLRICRSREEWPYKKLTVKYIKKASTFQDIFDKVRIEKFWLNTDMLRRLIVVVPDRKTRQKAKQRLEAYHKLLGVFTKFVLLKCLPEDDARLEHFRSSMLPKLRITYDENYDDFTVSELLKQQEFLSRRFNIPIEIFQYVEAESTNSTLVTWALSISSEKVFTIFQRAVQEFWSLKENSIIRFEIEGILQLHLRGKDLLKLIKEALQCNYNFLSCTEHVSRQLLALVDYSHPKRRSSELPSLYIKPLLQDSVPLSEPGVQARTCPSDVEVHRTMAERPGDGSSDQDMESGPVEDSPLLVSPRRGEGQQSTEQQRRPDDENKSIFTPITLISQRHRRSDRIRPNDDVGTDVEVTPDEEVSGLDGINVGDEDRPSKPIRSIVNIQFDSEADCVLQRDIFEAAQTGDVQTVKNYLDLGIPPDLVDEQGWSILHHAASHGQVDVMRLLHSKGCCVDPRDRHGRTPLHHAASSGACASIGVLVEELGSEVNPVDEDGFTPLKRSVDCEQYTVTKELLRCGRGVFLDEDLKSMLFQAAKTGDVQHLAAILESETLSRIDAVDINGCNALHWAAGSGAVEMVPLLIKCGFNVNRGDKMGKTALHVAAQYGHQEVVSTLVDAGCPIDVDDSNGWSALLWAASGGAVDMINFFIKCGVDVNRGSKTGVTALHVAALYGHQKVVSALVDAGCPIDVEDGNGFSCLHWAAEATEVGAVEMIYFLIKCGMDVHRGSELGVTALHVAAQYGHQKVVSTLVDAGCPIDVVDSNGFNALHWAAKSGAVEMIPFLIKRGVDVNRGDKTGRTALHVAAQYGHQKVVSALVNAGCLIDVVDINGCNALHWAAESGAVEMIPFLIKRGLDVNSGDNIGVTALHVAAQYGHQEVVSALVDSGCPIDMVDSNDYTALHYAARGGAVEMISFLIESEPGFDVNGEGKDGYTPLHEACDNSQLQAAFALLRHGALLTKVAGRYGTPLHVAATKDDASFIDDILKFQSMRLYSGPMSCRDSEHPESTNPLDVCDSFGMTPAFLAAGNGLIANLERLVANNCNIRVQSNIKFSIFDYAIVRGQMSQLQAIARACRVDAGSTSQGQLLRTLQAKDMLDPSKLLILGAIGGDPRVINSLFSEEDIFTEAAHQVWSDTYCRMLVEFNFSDDDKDDIYDSLCLPSASPLTPLQIAVIFLKCKTEYYRNVESQIAKTVQTAYAEFILRLLTHPVSMFTVNVRFHNGLSPLDVAQQFGLRDIADMIESAGGRPGMWADLPNEVMIPAMQLYTGGYGRHLSSHGPIGLASLSRVIERLVGVSPQLPATMARSVSQQTSADAVLNQKPTRNLLIKHVLSRVMIKQKWRSLCFLLDLEEEQVLKYRDDQGDDDPYQAVLFVWLEQGSQVSWEILFDAMSTFETNKTVNEIRAKVLEELQPSAVTSPPTPSPVPMPLALPPHHGVQTLAISGPAPHSSYSVLMPLPPLPTHGVPHYRPALHTRREALLPHQRLMDKYRDRLLKVVPAKELVLRWYNHQLVSEEVYYQINPEHVAPSTARDILFDYFWNHGTQQSFEKAFCQIMVEGGRMGYHQAAQLGREMQEELVTQLPPHH